MYSRRSSHWGESTRRSRSPRRLKFKTHDDFGKEKSCSSAENPTQPPGNSDYAKYSDRKMKNLFEDVKCLQGLVNTLKVDRDMRESQKKRTQIRR